VKRWSEAKSRLDVPPELRRGLARSFTLDVLAALVGTPTVGHIAVVTDEPELAHYVRSSRITLLLDRRPLGADRLNQAIEAGAHWTRATGVQGPALVVPADLPCLSAADVLEVQRRAEGHPRSFCADAVGIGTTLLLAERGSDLAPAYGVGSARHHTASGAVPIEHPPAGARRDVDTLQDLDEARAIGVGGHTRLVLRGAMPHLPLTAQAEIPLARWRRKGCHEDHRCRPRDVRRDPSLLP
jgi:2-phospho-L-lactate guanylyltransferase